MTLVFDLGVLLLVKIGCYINSYVSNGEIIPRSTLYFVVYIQHDPVQLLFSLFHTSSGCAQFFFAVFSAAVVWLCHATTYPLYCETKTKKGCEGESDMRSKFLFL